MTFLQEGASSLSGPAAMPMPQFVSATQIRLDLMEGSWDRAEPYLVPGGRELLEGNTVGLPAFSGRSGPF